ELALRVARLMRGDLCRSGAMLFGSRQVVFDLLATRARGVEVLARVADDLGLPTLAALDVVAQRRQASGELRPIDGRGVLLRLVQFSGLQRADVALPRLGQIEDHRVRVELRRRITTDGPSTVVFERGDDRLPRRFGRCVAAETRLDVSL